MAQTHSKLPFIFKQVAPVKQGFSRHSSTSASHNCPVYPMAQTQSKLPFKLMQVASFKQGFSRHSLTCLYINHMTVQYSMYIHQCITQSTHSKLPFKYHNAIFSSIIQTRVLQKFIDICTTQLSCISNSANTLKATIQIHASSSI